MTTPPTETTPATLRWPTPREFLTLRCPLCWGAPMFRSPLHMNAACAQCGHSYDRGNGYFLGAMMFSYTIVVVFLAAVVVSLRFCGVSWPMTLIVGSVLIPIIGPLVAFPYSRLWWVMIERRALRGGEGQDAELRAELASRKRRAAARAAESAALTNPPQLANRER